MPGVNEPNSSSSQKHHKIETISFAMFSKKGKLSAVDVKYWFKEFQRINVKMRGSLLKTIYMCVLYIYIYIYKIILFEQ